MYTLNRLLLITVTLLTVLSAHAFKVPALTGPVMDLADMVDPSTEAELESLIRRVNNSGAAQLQVLTIPSLQGEPIESVSIQITDQWKLGTKEKDNGVLLLVSRDDRALRIEVGQGLEGDLTDLYSRRIIDDVMVPQFRSDGFSQGITAGVIEIIRRVAPEFKLAGRADNSNRYNYSRTQKPRVTGLMNFIFMFLIFVLSIFFRIRRGLYGGWWSAGGGGFSGGGGWSGGGGGFSGGGASGRW